jgi:hypothetical protein
VHTDCGDRASTDYASSTPEQLLSLPLPRLRRAVLLPGLVKHFSGCRCGRQRQCGGDYASSTPSSWPLSLPPSASDDR